MNRNNLLTESRDDHDGIIKSCSDTEQITGILPELLSQAVIHSPCGYVITAFQQKGNPVVFVNRMFQELTGYQASEALGRNCSFLLGNDRKQEILKTFREAIKHKRPSTEVVRNYRKDGSLFYNELSVIPIHDQSGDVTHLIWIQRDVTPSVEAEKKYLELIAEKDKRFSTYMKNSNEALWRIDFNPPISFAAPEA